MAIYMDLHIVPGVNAKDVADAHSMDVLMEKEHSCKCLTYWIDELRAYVFCLIERDIPGAGVFTPADLKGISQKSCSVLKEMGTGIQWV